MKKAFEIVILILLCTTVLKSQQSRLNSMGGVSFSVNDVDSQLDPYNFGGNPAWIVLGQRNQRLEITPSSVFNWGNYRRHFDADGLSDYSASFVGIKPLGKSGTFKGSALYDYFVRRGNHRALTLEPYSGSSYMFTDTTSGNLRYKGPTFEFLHGLEIYRNLYFGASVDYQILNGLKNIYVYAETLYRNVSAKVGLAYKFNDKLGVGFYYSLFDSQERIEASDINLLTVRTFLYRGEKYKIELRGSKQNFKIKSDGKSFNFQIFSKPLPALQLGIKGTYYLHRSRYLFPQNNLIDDEDGYTSFGEGEVLLNARWLYSKRVTIGFTGGYYKENCWTKNSKRNLTTWKWNLQDVRFGAGISLMPPGHNILLAVEFEGHFVSADSMKYIDNLSNSVSAFNNTVKFGLEIPFSKRTKLHFGYNYLKLSHDFLYGYDNANVQMFVTGVELKISELFEIEPQIKYAFTTNNEDKRKEEFSSFIYLRFFKF